LTISDQPLVSLVMPFWLPDPDCLKQAVASALNQRDCSLELIVVDDGCETLVSELLSSFRDDRLRVLRVEHGGISRARNAGIAVSRGTAFRFIDGDDLLEPGSTARLVRMMDGRDDLITYGATIVCDQHLRPVYWIASTLRGPAAVPCLLDRFEVHICALLFPRRVVLAAGEWDPAIRVCQDWDFTLRALEHSHVRGDRAPAHYYRRHGNSNNCNPEARQEGIRRVVAGYFQRHPEAQGSRLERRAEAMLEIMAADQVTRGRPWRSPAFWRAGLTDPTAAVRKLRYRLGRSDRTPSRLSRKVVPALIRWWAGETYPPRS
jgi:glycosyltransferase involved in cell wall biosynthesis